MSSSLLRPVRIASMWLSRAIFSVRAPDARVIDVGAIPPPEVARTSRLLRCRHEVAGAGDPGCHLLLAGVQRIDQPLEAAFEIDAALDRQPLVAGKVRLRGAAAIDAPVEIALAGVQFGADQGDRLGIGRRLGYVGRRRLGRQRAGEEQGQQRGEQQRFHGPCLRWRTLPQAAGNASPVRIRLKIIFGMPLATPPQPRYRAAMISSMLPARRGVRRITRVTTGPAFGQG